MRIELPATTFLPRTGLILVAFAYDAAIFEQKLLR